MKLVITVVQDKDAQNLLDELVKQGYRATKLASTGGFLREGNTTIFMGIEESSIDHVMAIIKNVCQTRQQVVANLVSLGGSIETAVPYPVEVPGGGATIFVLDVEKYLKV